MAFNIRDRRGYAGRYSLERPELKTAEELALVTTGMLNSKPHEMGEGMAYRINRGMFGRLFGSFPEGPSEKGLTENVKGKTFVIWGSGDVGRGTAEIAKATGGKVVFIDIRDESLERRRQEFGTDGVEYINSSHEGAANRIDDLLSSKDTVGVTLGALRKAGRAPILLTRERLRRINERRRAAGANTLLITDAQIDQGGGVEGVHSTNHNEPFICIEGSVVYAVANVPGSCYTAGYASKQLQDATLEDTKRLVLARARGVGVFEETPLIKTALNTCSSMVTDKAVAEYFGREYTTPDEALAKAKLKPKGGKIILGVAGEIKDYENRVGLLPSGVKEVLEFAKANGINLEIWVEQGAGKGAGVSDEDYTKAGAKIKTRTDVLENADIIKGVKEPMGDEIKLIKEGTWMYTYFHYTGMKDSRMLDWAIANRITSFAYETRLDENGMLPQLKCMSDVDGRSNALVLAALNNPQIIEIGGAEDLIKKK